MTGAAAAAAAAKKKIADLSLKAASKKKMIDWDSMAKRFGSDDARRKLADLRCFFEESKTTLEPKPLDWDYYRQGVGNKIVDMCKEAYDTMLIPKHVSGVTPEYNAKLDALKEAERRSPTTKIGIRIQSFDRAYREHPLFSDPSSKGRIRLPESRVLYTVLRSPHIDKKSREQFQVAVKKEYLVMKAEKHELHKKFFWLKRQRIFGAQYELLFSTKTRLDKEKLQSLL
ncbi:Small ribosomal subunit protein uS10m-like protein [Drosera capensis]